MIQIDPNNSIKFKVLIAESNKERRQGLMHIEAMENDEGMLFIFDPGRNVSMWMRNTPMPLDMIFINKEGESSISQKIQLLIQQKESLLAELSIGFWK